MVERMNSDLANTLGNLVNRTISMSNKYFDGVVSNKGVDEEVDDDFKKVILDTPVKAAEKMDKLRVADAITEIFTLFKRCNKYIDETMPWAEILFARMDIKDVMEKVEEIKAAQKAETAEEKYPEVEKKPEITIDDFDKVQIQVGEVIKCEPVPKAKKLLVSQIKIGAETRQIVSGIAKYYKPEEMVGKKVAVITNLKPCKLCGVESQGMILAAGDDEGNLSVVTVDKDIVSGSEIC